MMNYRYSNLDEANDDRPIDGGIVAGALLSIVLVGAGILASGTALRYLDPASFGLVFGGTLGAALIHFSWDDVRRAWSELRRVVFLRTNDPLERILLLVQLATAVREEGLLVLDRASRKTPDPFLRLALELATEGEELPDLEKILRTELETSSDRAARAVQVFQTMGGYAPAMGLIGTLIGLIQMLSALNSPETVGPAMSLALVATLYGAVFSNFVFLPIAGKLRNRNEEETLVKAITIEGAVSLSRKESAVVLEQRLKMFMPGGARSDRP
jgi:chemotaxis protein MotA